MKTLFLIVIFVLPVSLFAQTNSAAYDQLMTLAGTFVNNGNLESARQAAQQVLQLDSHEWRGNALMAAILEKQGDFTNAQIYVLKAIAAAPPDKMPKLTEMAQAIAVGEAQGNTVQTTQPEQPTLEQTVAWMNAHFSDLACDIRVSSPYDATDGNMRCYGNKAATYTLIPMDISVTNNVLTLKMFELHQYRYLGTEQDTGGPDNIVNNQEVLKISIATIHTLSLSLKAVSATGDVSDRDFWFECSYLSDANAKHSPPSGNKAMDAEMSTELESYGNGHTVYWLVIYANSPNAITDSMVAGDALTLQAGQTTIAITDDSNTHNYYYTNLPSELSSPQPSWVDPNQDDLDPTKLKEWVAENSQKNLPSGFQDGPTGSPTYPMSIAICNTDKNVLKQWQQALQRLIDLNKGNNMTTEDSAPSYDQLLNQAGILIASNDLDAAKKIAQQLLQLDGQRWQGNALMGWLLDQEGNLTGGYDYVLKTIRAAPRPLPFRVEAWNGSVQIRNIRAIVPIPSDAKLTYDDE